MKDLLIRDLKMLKIGMKVEVVDIHTKDKKNGVINGIEERRKTYISSKGKVVSTTTVTFAVVSYDEGGGIVITTDNFGEYKIHKFK